MENQQVAALFDGWQETMIWSALQGIMGKIDAACDRQGIPRAARVLSADFAFLAGEPTIALVDDLMDDRDFLLAVPQNESWAKLIAACFPEAKRITRYAIKKEGDIFDRGQLVAFAAALPKEYTLAPIDRALFHKALEQRWSRDFCANFEDYAMYEKWGLGVAVLRQGEIVSGASSYTAYQGGIEVEIHTRRDCRRKGLALACASQLILDCLDRGLYPSWDAANLESVALAQKLGYHFDREYLTLELHGSPDPLPV